MSSHKQHFLIRSVLVAGLLHATTGFAEEGAPASVTGAGAALQADIPITAGQCWIYGQIKPRPVEETIAVTVKDSQTRIQVTPAEMRKGYKRVITREGTLTYRLQPPTYKQVEEQVMIRPEVTNFVRVPAVYEKREKNVIVEEARTVLEQCRAAGSRYSQGTGAIAFCSREIPAKHEVVATQVLVKPEQTRVEVEPAQYETVTKWVIDRPARVVEVTLDPQIGEVAVEEVVSPAQTRQLEIAAETRSLLQTRYEGESRIVMRRAVCNADITPELVTDLQQRLGSLGYQPGEVDGLLGKRTLSALSEYQVNTGLAVGAITYESLTALEMTSYQ